MFLLKLLSNSSDIQPVHSRTGYVSVVQVNENELFIIYFIFKFYHTRNGCSVGLYVDSFTVSFNSPNGRHLPAVRVVQGDC